MSAVLIQKVRNGFIMSPYAGGTACDINEIFVYDEISPYGTGGNKMIREILEILCPKPVAEPAALPEVVAELVAAKAELEGEQA